MTDYISRAVRGHTSVTLAAATRITRALGVTLSEVLEKVGGVVRFNRGFNRRTPPFPLYTAGSPMQLRSNETGSRRHLLLCLHAIILASTSSTRGPLESTSHTNGTRCRRHSRFRHVHRSWYEAKALLYIGIRCFLQNCGS